MRVLLIVTFFIYSFAVFAQTNCIVGRVLDISDGKPLEGVHVYIVNTKGNAVSDENGVFKLNIKVATIHLQLSYLGYSTINKTIELVSSKDSIYNFPMTPVAKDMETVVVTATRNDKILKEVPVLTQVIYPSSMIEKGVTNVISVLEREIPGVELSTFNSQQRVTFQGMTSDYILFLVDGERLAGEMNGDIDYSRLNLNNIERIEVVRGAMSAMYGSNAIGGVINFISKKPTDKMNVNSFVRYTTFNELSNSNSISFKHNNFSSLSNMSFNQTEGYDLTPATTSTFTQEKFKNVLYNQKFGYDIGNKLVLTSNAGVYYKRLYDGHVRPADHGYAGVNGNFKAQYFITDSAKIEFSYAVDKYFNYEILKDQNGLHRKTAADQLQSYKLSGFISHLKTSYSSGIEFLPEKIYSERITNENRDASESILWSQVEHKICKGFSAIGGVRITNHSVFGFNVVPKFSFMSSYKSFIFRISYGMGFRSPTLKELYFDFDHMGQFTLMGNENLSPEKSKNLSFSTEWNVNRVNITVNTYYSTINDMIANNWLNKDTIQYKNISSATIYGIDLMSKWMPFRGFTVGTGLGLVRSENNQTHKQLYDISPVSANLSLGYMFKYYKMRTNIDLFGKYTGDRYYEPIDITEFHDKPYNTWKLSITQSLYQSLNIVLGIDNIFDKVDPESFDNISPGRVYYITINYKFARY